ncbi:serine-rich adhesin for platelets-like [Palaemon carinicauda]|uniref:serine-rich adhesin for platelets-like n=1 Tax=Palaemon carinicauda TaxID=392227 RepID=UPI0035B66047
MSLPLSEQPQGTVQTLGKAILQVVGHSKNASFIKNVLTHLQATNPKEAEQHLEKYLWLILHKQQGIDIPPEVVSGITTLPFKQELALRKSKSNKNLCQDYEQSPNLPNDCIYDENQEFDNLSPSLLLDDIFVNASEENFEDETLISGLSEVYPVNPYWPARDTYDASSYSLDVLHFENFSSTPQTNLTACMKDPTLRVLNGEKPVRNCDERGNFDEPEADGKFSLKDHIGEDSTNCSSTCLPAGTPQSSAENSASVISSDTCLENREVLIDGESFHDNEQSVDLQNIQKNELEGAISHCIDKAIVMLAGTTQNLSPKLSPRRLYNNKDAKTKFHQIEIDRGHFKETQEFIEIGEQGNNLEKSICEEFSGQNSELHESPSSQSENIFDTGDISLPKLSFDMLQTLEEKYQLRATSKYIQLKETSLADEETHALEDAHDNFPEPDAEKHFDYGSIKDFQSLQENTLEVSIIQIIDKALEMLDETNNKDTLQLSPMHNDSLSCIKEPKSESSDNSVGDIKEIVSLQSTLKEISKKDSRQEGCNLFDDLSTMNNEPRPPPNISDIDEMNKDVNYRTCCEDLLRFAKRQDNLPTSTTIQMKSIPITKAISMAMEMLSQEPPKLHEESAHNISRISPHDATLQDENTCNRIPQNVASDDSQSSEIFQRALTTLNAKDLNCSYDIPLQDDPRGLEPPNKKIKNSFSLHQATQKTKSQNKNMNFIELSSDSDVDASLGGHNESEDLILSVTKDDWDKNTIELSSEESDYKGPSSSDFDDSDDLQIIWENNAQSDLDISVSFYADIDVESDLNEVEKQGHHAMTDKETSNNNNVEVSSIKPLPSVISSACAETKQKQSEILASSIQNDDTTVNSITRVSSNFIELEARENVLSNVHYASEMISANSLRNANASHEMPSDNNTASSPKSLEHDKAVSSSEIKTKMTNLLSFSSNENLRSATTISSSDATALPDNDSPYNDTHEPKLNLSKEKITGESEYMEEIDDLNLENFTELNTSDVDFSILEFLDSFNASLIDQQKEAFTDKEIMDVVNNSSLMMDSGKETVACVNNGLEDLTDTFAEDQPFLTSSPLTAERFTAVSGSKIIPFYEEVVASLNPELLTLETYPTDTKEGSEERAWPGEINDQSVSDEQDSESLLKGIECNDILQLSHSLGCKPLQNQPIENETSSINSHYYEDGYIAVKSNNPDALLIPMDISQSSFNQQDQRKISQDINTVSDNNSQENVVINEDTYNSHNCSSRYDDVSEYENKTKSTTCGSEVSLKENKASLTENNILKKENHCGPKIAKLDLNMERDLNMKSLLTIPSDKELNASEETMNTMRVNDNLRSFVEPDKSLGEACEQNEFCEKGNTSSCVKNDTKGSVISKSIEEMTEDSHSFNFDWNTSSSSVLESYHSTLSVNNNSDNLRRSEDNMDICINNQSDILPVDIVDNTSTVKLSPLNDVANSNLFKDSSSINGVICDGHNDKMSSLELRLSQYIETVCLARNSSLGMLETTGTTESPHLKEYRCFISTSVEGAHIKRETLDIYYMDKESKSGCTNSSKGDSTDNPTVKEGASEMSKTVSTAHGIRGQEVCQEKTDIGDSAHDITKQSVTNGCQQLTVDKEYIEKLVDEYFPIQFSAHDDQLHGTVLSQNEVIADEVSDFSFEDEEIFLGQFLCKENVKNSDTSSVSVTGHETTNTDRDNSCLSPNQKQVKCTTEPGETGKPIQSCSINNQREQLRSPILNEQDSPRYEKKPRSQRCQSNSGFPVDKTAKGISEASQSKFNNESDETNRGKHAVQHEKDNIGLHKEDSTFTKVSSSDADDKGIQQKDLSLHKESTSRDADYIHKTLVSTEGSKLHAPQVCDTQDEADSEIMDWECIPLETEEPRTDINEITETCQKEKSTEDSTEYMMWE